MSAFLCSDRHTAVVAIIAHREGMVKDVFKAMTMLRGLNNESLKQRYGAKPVRMVNRNTACQEAMDWLKGATAADVSQVVNCFAYQCSEGTVLESSGGQTLVALAEEAHKGIANRASMVWAI